MTESTTTTVTATPAGVETAAGTPATAIDATPTIELLGESGGGCCGGGSCGV